jgi:DNA mismatch endonuclease (patch repair protein)
MTDVFSAAKRSEVMSRIKGRDNKETELVLAAIFRKNKITGWRRQFPVEGRPDFAFPTHRVAVFVDGCFWHGCPKHSNMPRNNRAFWKKKLSGNARRDKSVALKLKKSGWKVIRIWEHALRERPAHEVRRITSALQS